MTAQTVRADANAAGIPFGNMALLGLRHPTPPAPVRLQLASVSPLTAPEAVQTICDAAQAGQEPRQDAYACVLRILALAGSGVDGEHYL